MILFLVVLSVIMLLLGVCAIAAMVCGGRAERCADEWHPTERVHYLPAEPAGRHPSVMASG